jgi:uncharacterized protein YdhG (YjbR/CyaY superfamily)
MTDNLVVGLEFEIRTDKMEPKRGTTIIQRFQKELETWNYGFTKGTIQIQPTTVE